MRRRTFLASLGAAAAWPLVTRAQQRDRIRRIALMMTNAEGDAEGVARATAFREALAKFGWIEGRDVQLDFRWSANDPDFAQSHAAELAKLSPDVILANGTPAVAALRRSTRDVPVVFVVVVDPVGAGFVQSLARPGGNVTGFSTFEPEIGGKWLELLKQIAPNTKRVALISDPAFKGFAALLSEIEQRAPSAGLQPTRVLLHDPSDNVESAVGTFAQQGNGGMVVLPTAINNSQRKRILEVAKRHALPAIYPFRFFASDGGLMSYGIDILDLFKRGASYIDRILKGERPADLPVQAPTKFELVINLKTAKSLGLDVPPNLLFLADEVIE